MVCRDRVVVYRVFVFVYALVILLACECASALVVPSKCRQRKGRIGPTADCNLQLKRDGLGDNEGHLHYRTDKGPLPLMWRALVRFLPVSSRAKLEKTYNRPKSDTGNRYHVQLVNPSAQHKRHAITRLRRYCPDMSWATAEEIVITAITDGRSLARIFNSRSEAEYLVDMLHQASPAVPAQIYDSKRQEVIRKEIE